LLAKSYEERKLIMKKKRFLIPGAILILVLVFWSILKINTYKPDSIALEAMKSDNEIDVKIDKNIIFTPKNKIADTGFIFYPGGLVEPEAYAPICKKISEKGYKVIIVPMPLNLAIFGEARASSVMKDNPDIKNWVIGGHSLGGVMAASYTFKHTDSIKGLALYASYPQEKHNLESKEVKVISLWGGNDKVADIEKVKAAKSILPEGAKFMQIDGGNHSQFGNYGFQKGDGIATTSYEEQQKKAAEQTIDLIKSISK
jgi:hypothetical protein